MHSMDKSCKSRSRSRSRSTTIAEKMRPEAIESIPENILLQILSHLPVKDRCIAGRVCKQWRRIVGDNSLWRHVDLLQYRLDLTKMWKVLRAHFSPCLLTMKIRGFAHAVGRKRKRVSVSDSMLKELALRCPNLWLLHLHDCNTDNVSANSLPPSLRSLAVTHSTWQPRWLGDHVEHLLGLENLDLSGSVRVDKFDLQDICQFSNLSKLSLNGCYRIRGPDINVILTGLPLLVSLDLSNTGVDQQALHHMARNSKRLRELRLANCSSVCDSSLVTLTLGLTQLRDLDVSGCAALTLEGLKSLWSLSEFNKLVIKDKPHISSMDLDWLKKGFSQKVDVITS